MDYITPISAFFGSSVVVAAITHWLTVSQARVDFKKRKLEELYLSAADFKCAMSLMCLTIQDVKIEKITPAEGMKKIHDLMFQSHKDYDTVTMLSNIYFPQLVAHWEKLLEQKKALADVIAKHLQFHKTMTDQDFLLFAPVAVKLNDVYGSFLTAFYEVAKKT